MRYAWKKYTFLCLLLLFLHDVFAQSMLQSTLVSSEDGKVKTICSLSENILLHESIADTVRIFVEGEKELYLSALSTDKLLKVYDSNHSTLNKMTFEGEPYCDYVPNCDKVFRLPFIKAVQKLGNDKYALIGFVRAKSPVTIIRHVWILDISGAPRIEKKIAFFGNEANYLAFGYNLLQNELFIFQHLPRSNEIRKKGIFVIDKDMNLSRKGISIVPFSKSDFQLFVKKAQMQENNDIGWGIYQIPSGERYERLPTIVEGKLPMYKVLLD